MVLKEKILKYLLDNHNVHISGEHLSKIFQVSRSAVWKAVTGLRKEGYQIHAVTNKGYILEKSIYSKAGISRYLERDTNIIFFESIASTNDYIMSNAGNLPAFTAVFAKEQTKGKGRKGRSFYSPKNTGLYFSLLLKPDKNIVDVLYITTLAAVSVCLALEEITGEKLYIKWVNDIYMNNKKVCGILTEASMDMETGSVENIVLGVGINLFMPELSFPKEISSIAGTVFNTPCSDENIINIVSAEILNNIYKYYEEMDSKSFFPLYKERSFIIGKRIEIVSSKAKEKALALDIDNECRLFVLYEDGRKDTLLSGEVSIIL